MAIPLEGMRGNHTLSTLVDDMEIEDDTPPSTISPFSDSLSEQQVEVLF